MNEKRELWRGTIKQEGKVVVMVSGDRHNVLTNLVHYTIVYVQDGPVNVTIEKVSS